MAVARAASATSPAAARLGAHQREQGRGRREEWEARVGRVMGRGDEWATRDGARGGGNTTAVRQSRRAASGQTDGRPRQQGVPLAGAGRFYLLGVFQLLVHVRFHRNNF
jgi:hypothetical protein